MAGPGQNTSAIPPPPDGFVPIPAPPAGFVPVAAPAPPVPGPSTADDMAAINRMNAPQTLGMKVSAGFDTGAEDMLKGMGEGALSTVTGVSNLIHKIPGVGETLAPQSGIDQMNELARPTDTMQKAGVVGEGALEWAAGDEALKGISTLVKTPEAVLQLMERYPKAAKIITSLTKAATIGGAQGAIKGEATNQAEAGAVGGAAGGAVSEGVGQIAKPVLRLFGLGGLDSEEAMVKAGRPGVNAHKTFKQSVQVAMPRLVAANKEEPFETLGGFADTVHVAANNLWKNEVIPQILRHPNEIIDGSPIAEAIHRSILEGVEEGPSTAAGRAKLFPEDDKVLRAVADKFANRPISLIDAQGELQAINAKLRPFYEMSAEQRYAARYTNPDIQAWEAAADSLRDSITNKLWEKGEADSDLLRQQYGALKQIQRVFEKRAAVSDRQAPLNITQVLSLIGGATEAGGAAMTGHPAAALAGAVPPLVATIARARNSSESLLRQGLKAGARELEGPNAMAEAAKGATSTIAKAAGAAAGRGITQNNWPALAPGHTRIVDHYGVVHDIPTENLDKARQLDPGLKVLPPQQ